LVKSHSGRVSTASDLIREVKASAMLY